MYYATHVLSYKCTNTQKYQDTNVPRYKCAKIQMN